LAVILAGGRSRRFGSAKAFAPLGDVHLLERVRAALAATGARVVAIGEDARLAQSGFEVRPDRTPHLGPLGGLQSALEWAVESGYTGVLLAGCDMPFISSALVRHLIGLAHAGESLAVVPESGTDGRVEPLCAWYSTDLLPEVELRLQRSALALGDLLSHPQIERLPELVVRTFGDPEMMFMNVNTPEDYDRAMRLLHGSSE
jgi:molybdenum cofactor guanylyltransferase